MKGREESNINGWFPFMYSQKWNCYFQNRIIMFCLPVPIHSNICERFIYFQDRSAYSAAGKYADRSWEYINGSQTHECGNWDWGRAIPRKGIHKWNFSCSVVYWSTAAFESKAIAVCVAYPAVRTGKVGWMEELVLLWGEEAWRRSLRSRWSHVLASCIRE